MDTSFHPSMDARPIIETAPTDLLPGCPHRPLDWRWLRAGQLLETGARKRRRDDDWVVRARRFRRSLERFGSDSRLARADPAILAACQLFEVPGRIRWEVEARLLAGLADGEIAAKFGVGAEVITAYEALFFEVRDHLDCSDWVALVAIGPRLYQGFDSGELEILWKLFAYHGGPLVLDALIAATGGGSAGSADGAPDPRLAELFGLVIAVITTPSLGSPLDWARLNHLSAEIHRRGPPRSSRPLPGPSS